ncbi:flagellin-like protein [Halarchaeum solikamskense]|uniref:type IV pilin n=1 Tax=Halarchaeum nitratireducens TaxID=489913 RepID=UPI001B3B0F0E|nr:type IV pilin N-terminal domain-containing protein [Halarchaeum solikamskense]MBP2251169.1 flagellin-like protein [Halarchaeum solikamskense]
MDLTQLLDDDRGVSPVIGVILMVAITVILAAVIGTFVLGLGSNVGNNAPSATFNYDYNDSAENLTITHQGGDALDNSSINVTASGQGYSVDYGADINDDDQWTAGDDAVVNYTGSLSSGDGAQVIWQSSGGSSSIIGEWEYQG